jgi:hypothetical protein
MPSPKKVKVSYAERVDIKEQIEELCKARQITISEFFRTGALREINKRRQLRGMSPLHCDPATPHAQEHAHMR